MNDRRTRKRRRRRGEGGGEGGGEERRGGIEVGKGVVPLSISPFLPFLPPSLHLSLLSSFHLTFLRLFSGRITGVNWVTGETGLTSTAHTLGLLLFSPPAEEWRQSFPPVDTWVESGGKFSFSSSSKRREVSSVLGLVSLLSWCIDYLSKVSSSFREAWSSFPPPDGREKPQFTSSQPATSASVKSRITNHHHQPWEALLDTRGTPS